MNKRTAPCPVPWTAGPTTKAILNATDRVSQAYVNGDDADGGVVGLSGERQPATLSSDPERISNLCDIGAHVWCNGNECACSCHRREDER